MSSFAIDPQSGRLDLLATVPLPDNMAYVATDRAGRFLLSASYTGHKIAINPIGPKGAAQGEPVQVLETRKHAHALLFAAPKHPYTRALMSAVLEPDPVAQRRKTRTMLTGELPSPSNVPPGCAFHTRCPLATPICSIERPELATKLDGARVACHHA